MSTNNSKRKPAKKRAKTQLRAVTAEHPCPVCGGNHKCTIGDDKVIFCGRRSGAVPGFRCHGPAAGDPQFWVYRFVDEQFENQGDDDHDAEDQQSEINWGKLHVKCKKALTEQLADEFAGNLGVPATILHSLGLGWHSEFQCWTSPERDASRRIVGINRRYRDGGKRMIQGGSRGLVFPKDWDDTNVPIICVEGFSDSAALAAMGLTAIGRPSNFGGVDHLVELLKDVPSTRTIIIVGENDRKPDGSWPGRDGAVGTAERLAMRLRRPVLIAYPPEGEGRSLLADAEPRSRRR